MRELQKALDVKKSGQLDKARDLLKALAENESRNAAVFYHCAVVHDQLGLELDAVPYYKKALELGLDDEKRRSAMLGLGSTYRALGLYEEARSMLAAGIAEYPQAREFLVFLSITLYNLGEHEKSTSILLKQLAETTGDKSIASYKRAILFYADHLNEVW
ncbi:hypothetical protein CVD25_20140 [Bacillus canaveralius]|uniref:Tetratrico peptide repeat group 5 domain-containing protein n=1 Tax=Bacillus canaveralius TaxID=1403243 RepID=A0A2N5GN33_9BACI|nr:tetratricopeptide repeat protein [Bacillus canaveralius]PLR83627.1 hypothetical protein CU635_08705 [Bacillus canaveralius]PLR90828.1 hypothetical protein CVD25_20140 [Bacillus canaveralius]RSK45082.1 tetratricopeptide repeat protein [Bacillus canaveralius]